MYVYCLLSVPTVNAQSVMPGRCPRPAVQGNFNAARYLGTWYDIQRLPQAFQKGECSSATYSPKSCFISTVYVILMAKYQINILNNLLSICFSADGNNNSISGPAKAKNPSEPAKLLPTLPEETLEELRSALSSTGVSVDKLLSTNQDVAYCSAMHQ
uniref:Lipocalin/cytosolic fatty-acid binding domain-containing protein n=1 Tax=Echeneis naucrates TaxID=173247 RepID=A0A665X5H2_ECHNA